LLGFKKIKRLHSSCYQYTVELKLFHCSRFWAPKNVVSFETFESEGSNISPLNVSAFKKRKN
jgi:hypothetical protein